MRATAISGFALVVLVAGLSAQQPTSTNSVGMEFVLIQPGSMTVAVFHPPYPKPVDPNAPPAAGRAGGGRGGTGTTLAPQVFADGDRNKDGRLDREEFSGLADTWFDRMDAAKAGRLNQQEFTQRFATVTAPGAGPGPAAAPAAAGAGAQAAGAGGRGAAGGRGGGAGGTLFMVADANRDGFVGRDELKALFGNWFAAWDAARTNALTVEQMVAGLNTALPGAAAPARGTPLTPADYARIEQMAKANYSDGFTVKIDRPYYIGKYEVTQADWKKVMGTNPSLFQGGKVADNADKHPVENITWDDAQAFIKKLNALEKTNAYRLPTEFEWEYAARAGADADTPWTQIREQAITGYNAYFNTHMVGEKKPNAWGLYDTLGNVWEWVQDFYNEKVFADPVPPKSGRQHVLKGGGFVADVKNAIPATHAAGPGSGFDVGFRIVKDVR